MNSHIYDLFTPVDLLEELREAREEYRRQIENGEDVTSISSNIPEINQIAIENNVDSRVFQFARNFLQENRQLPREHDILRFCLRNSIRARNEIRSLRHLNMMI